MRSWLKGKWRNLLPYVIVCAVAVASVQAIFAVGQRADRRLCEAINENRAIILMLINSQGTPIQAPPGSPEFVQQILDASAQRGAAFRAQAAQALAPKDCSSEGGFLG